MEIIRNWIIPRRDTQIVDKAEVDMTGSRVVVAYRADSAGVWYGIITIHSKLVILITQLQNKVVFAIRPILSMSRAAFEC